MQVYPLMKDCWLPLPAQRKKPQVIMRDMNQMLYKVRSARSIRQMTLVLRHKVVLEATNRWLCGRHYIVLEATAR
jgi:hypothetical protein